jgi:hypothetical protein
MLDLPLYFVPFFSFCSRLGFQKKVEPFLIYRRLPTALV